MRIAVIVTTYNWPDALAAVLDGFLDQQDREFELLVADDGSTEETGRLIAEYQSAADFPIEHVWHADNGFRAGAIRNRALASTTADYVIFTDGDCIPLPNFVAQHRKLAEAGWFLSGNRILLSERFSRRVLQERLAIPTWNPSQWMQARLKGDVNRMLPIFSWPVPDRWRKRRPLRWRGAKTCHLAAWRQDLFGVNGFDEDYQGWGLEDSDLVLRLIHAGVKHKDARYATSVWHLWHQENSRDGLAENQRRLEQLLATRRTIASVGLNKYQSDRGNEPLVRKVA